MRRIQLHNFGIEIPHEVLLYTPPNPLNNNNRNDYQQGIEMPQRCNHPTDRVNTRCPMCSVEEQLQERNTLREKLADTEADQEFYVDSLQRVWDVLGEYNPNLTNEHTDAHSAVRTLVDELQELKAAVLRQETDAPFRRGEWVVVDNPLCKDGPFKIQSCSYDFTRDEWMLHVEGVGGPLYGSGMKHWRPEVHEYVYGAPLSGGRIFGVVTRYTHDDHVEVRHVSPDSQPLKFWIHVRSLRPHYDENRIWS